MFEVEAGADEKQQIKFVWPNHEFASSLENTLALAIWSRQTRGNSKRAPCSFLLIESTDSTIESTNSMIIVFISMLAL